MSKCLNEETFDATIDRVLDHYKKRHDENYDFDTESESNPYGDTWATTSVEPTERSLQECEDDFVDNFDVDDFIHDFLQEDDTFRELIRDRMEKRFRYGVKSSDE